MLHCAMPRTLRKALGSKPLLDRSMRVVAPTRSLFVAATDRACVRWVQSSSRHTVARHRLLRRLHDGPAPRFGERALQANPPIAANPIAAFEALSAWVLSKTPRGFGKFYPKGAAKGDASKGTPKPAASSSSKGSGGTGGSSGSGSGSGSSGGGPLNNPLYQAGMVIGSIVLFQSLFSGGDGESATEISWQTFKREYLEPGRVEKVVISNKSVAKVYVKSLDEQTGSGETNTTGGYEVDSKDPAGFRSLGNYEVYFNIGSMDSFERKLNDLQDEMAVHPRDYVPVMYVSEVSVAHELLKLAPTLLLIGFFLAMSRGAISQMGGMGGAGGMMGVGKAKPNIVTKHGNVGVKFKDVAGCDEAKVEVMEFVDFLKNPKKYERLGADLPKGALLHGPPGTGKTMLAKATAGEAAVPFLSMNGSDFIEMFVGVGPARVRDLFEQARKSAPCILFIDEIDAIGRARGRGGVGGGNDERENTLNQILVEMDGFNTTSGVVIFGGTNRPDILDKALMRPGRFDRQIEIGIPDKAGRVQILKVHLESLKMEGEIDKVAERLGHMTPGMSGAELANVCNEAGLIAARNERTSVAPVDFESAIDRVIGGIERKSKVLDPKERETIAYHEAGHAVTGWYLEHVDPLLKVSIVPRGAGALGYAQYVPREQFLKTTDDLKDTLCLALGGKVAEQLFGFGASSGAQNDLERVTQIAQGMVSTYGMNDRIGLVAYPSQDGTQFNKPYGEETARMIDEEVGKIIKEAHDRTTALLTERKSEVETIALLLLDKEKITAEDVQKAIGDRPFEMKGGFSIPDAEEDSDDSAGEAAEPNVAEEPAEEAPEEGTTTGTMPPAAFAFESSDNPAAGR